METSTIFINKLRKKNNSRKIKINIYSIALCITLANSSFNTQVPASISSISSFSVTKHSFFSVSFISTPSEVDDYYIWVISCFG